MMKGVFTAGDGDLSIVYSSGAHLWGSWGVTYSEGLEPEDFEADRSLGYVGDVGHTGSELASRLWIRKDVSIDQDAKTSTVPEVFRNARERTSGDVVVDREVSGAGLGGLVPHVDFNHGDEMGTVIGPKIVPLPVTRIDYVVSAEEGSGYVVGVGKGLLGDMRELDSWNERLEGQIRKETAERERQQKRLDEMNRGLTGSNYGSISDAVRGGLLDGALGRLNYQNAQVAGGLEDLDTVFQPVKELVDDQIAVGGELRGTVGQMDNIVNGSSTPKYNSNLWKLNNSAWKLQNSFNSSQTLLNTWTTGSIEALDDRIPNFNQISGSGSNTLWWGVFSVDKNSWKFTSRGGWTGWILVFHNGSSVGDSKMYVDARSVSYSGQTINGPTRDMNEAQTSVCIRFSERKMPTIALPSHSDRDLKEYR